MEDVYHGFEDGVVKEQLHDVEQEEQLPYLIKDKPSEHQLKLTLMDLDVKLVAASIYVANEIKMVKEN